MKRKRHNPSSLFTHTFPQLHANEVPSADWSDDSELPPAKRRKVDPTAPTDPTISTKISPHRQTSVDQSNTLETNSRSTSVREPASGLVTDDHPILDVSLIPLNDPFISRMLSNRGISNCQSRNRQSVVHYLRKYRNQNYACPLDNLVQIIRCDAAMLKNHLRDYPFVRVFQGSDGAFFVELTDPGRTMFIKQNHAIYYVVLHFASRTKPMSAKEIEKIVNGQSPQVTLSPIRSVTSCLTALMGAGLIERVYSTSRFMISLVGSYFTSLSTSETNEAVEAQIGSPPPDVTMKRISDQPQQPPSLPEQLPSSSLPAQVGTGTSTDHSLKANAIHGLTSPSISVSRTLPQRNKFNGSRNSKFSVQWFERAVVQYLRKETSHNSFQFLSDSLNCTHSLLQQLIDRSSCLRLSSNAVMVELTEIGRTKFLTIESAVIYVLFHHSTRSKPLKSLKILEMIQTKTVRSVSMSSLYFTLSRLIKIGIVVRSLRRRRVAAFDQDNDGWRLSNEVDDYHSTRYSVGFILSSTGRKVKVTFPPDVSPSTTLAPPPPSTLSEEEILRRQSLFHELSSTLMTNDDYVMMVRILTDFGGLSSYSTRRVRKGGRTALTIRANELSAKCIRYLEYFLQNCVYRRTRRSRRKKRKKSRRRKKRKAREEEEFDDEDYEDEEPVVQEGMRREELPETTLPPPPPPPRPLLPFPLLVVRKNWRVV